MTRVLETYSLLWEPTDPVSEHVSKNTMWEACGEEHGVPLARLRVDGEVVVLEGIGQRRQ